MIWAAALLLVSACTAPPPKPHDERIPGERVHDGMVHIVDEAVGGAGGYWIDRYEYPNEAGEPPLVYVNLATAEEKCAAAQKRVCTAAEWRRACLGPAGTNTYGYGPTFVSRRCHTEHRLPSGHTSMMDVNELVSKAGDYPECSTPEGVYDLVGNAEEWVLDDWRGVGAMLEGGAFYTWTGYADCSGNYSREPDYRLDPRQAVYSAGFRCCTSAEAPTAAALSPERIGADARARIAAGRAASSTATYDPTNEVEVTPGTYIDIYEYPNRAGELPVTTISWADAGARCAAAGKRLCTAQEWDLACAGQAGFRFPYGNDYVEGACSVAVGHRTRSGAAFACLAESGARDLVGGVWEWTSTELDTEGVLPGTKRDRREVRGGSAWSDYTKSVCAPVEGYPESPADATLPDLGFRCCRGQRPPEPLVARPGHRACPTDMVSVAGAHGDICVDRHEYPNRAGEVPRGALSFAEAQRACVDAGKQLCREADWLAVCSGEGARRWPYGNLYVPARCSDRAHDGGALPSGARPQCATPEGVVDMSGNLWEWTDAGDGSGILHGGGWNFSAGVGQCRAEARAADGYRDPQFGVRCCSPPAPG